MTKICKECNQELPLESFHRHSGFKDGRRTKCKECTAKSGSAYYQSHKTEHMQRVRKWQNKNKNILNEYQRVRRQKIRAKLSNYKDNPLKVEAVKKLNYAVFKGEIQRGSCCQICGDVTDAIQGHHYDYNKPLEVIWLCTACHGYLHRISAPRTPVQPKESASA